MCLPAKPAYWALSGFREDPRVLGRLPPSWSRPLWVMLRRLARGTALGNQGRNISWTANSSTLGGP